MKPKPLSPLNHFTVPVAMSAPSQAVGPPCADPYAAALITRAEPTRQNEKAPGWVSDNPSGAGNVYGNQNCNPETVAQTRSSPVSPGVRPCSGAGVRASQVLGGCGIRSFSCWRRTVRRGGQAAP